MNKNKLLSVLEVGSRITVEFNNFDINTELEGVMHKMPESWLLLDGQGVLVIKCALFLVSIEVSAIKSVYLSLNEARITLTPIE